MVTAPFPMRLRSRWPSGRCHTTGDMVSSVTVANGAAAGWAGRAGVGLLMMDVLGQLESSSEGCGGRASLGEMLPSILHIILAASIQHRIQNSSGNNFSLWNNSSGRRSMSYFFPSPHATLVCGCVSDADGCGMGDSPLARTGTWQERSVRIWPLPLAGWCLYGHVFTLGR